VREGGYDFKRCQGCGKAMALEGMEDRAPASVRGNERRPMLIAVGLAILASVAGVLVAVTTAGLIGPILIVGGVMALGVVALPAAIENVARWLSTGTLRRRWREPR
jgi:hypothetical protein